MRSTHIVIAAALAISATACSPTFNWRELNVDGTRLKAMLPCKPDQDSREVQIAGKPAKLEVLACDAGGAKFALLHADLGEVILCHVLDGAGLHAAVVLAPSLQAVDGLVVAEPTREIAIEEHLTAATVHEEERGPGAERLHRNE